jgi:hypothetical protein
MKIIFSDTVGNGSRNIPTKVFEMLEQVYLLIFAKFSCSWIRIRIPNTVPDNHCGSGSTAPIKMGRIMSRAALFEMQL